MKYATAIEKYREARDKREQDNCAPHKMEKRRRPIVDYSELNRGPEAEFEEVVAWKGNRSHQFLRAMSAFQKRGRPVVVATVVVRRCTVKIERAEDESTEQEVDECNNIKTELEIMEE